jgi:hypothetical protein
MKQPDKQIATLEIQYLGYKIVLTKEKVKYCIVVTEKEKLKKYVETLSLDEAQNKFNYFCQFLLSKIK